MKNVKLIVVILAVICATIVLLSPLFGDNESLSLIALMIFILMIVIIVFGVLVLDKLQSILDELKHH